ncbi:NAD(P)/FAD-dependent oxidoreductase [Blastococcus sp. KM273128]|uniref:NAD(P)/FAD-dependent oxidoreductase n=1 Tax=Blastococcus sp. KM273128 TaxID=2570314 RepID=UPI001F248D2D|nr:NAD(P)/FAD-dependent oxidoreductase [Blastococcus sp. KM273128]MCF6744051.1 NAD(P)/FAD-dependent oxidoreductase [Blastococcus sp. KM273128]
MSGTENGSGAVDVIIIGAGPAGAVAAYHLARAGRSVLVLERRSLPRFHVGESQVPYTAELVREMDLWPAILAAGYPVKRGAEFIFPNGDFRRTDFADQGEGRQPAVFQVERGHFDNLLIRHAVAAGAQLLERAVVDELFIEGERVVGVRYEHAGVVHEVRAGHLLDAGGRAAKTAKTFRTRRSIPWLQNVAVFRHYDGLDESANPGHEGDIQVGGHPDGWVWAIPIWSDVISIGAVMPATALRAAASAEEVLDEHISRVPRIVARLAGATPRRDLHVESDYCYFSDVVTGPGWTMAGDAGHFIDPIFSGGTFLAMLSGREAARAVDAILRGPEREEELQAAYACLYKTGYDTYTRLISAYYESDYRLGAYLHQRGFSIEGDPHFARILSGDFWSDNNPFGEWLRAQPRWDTFAPYERVTTCPVYPHIDALERAPVLPALI